MKRRKFKRVYLNCHLRLFSKRKIMLMLHLRILYFLKLLAKERLEKYSNACTNQHKKFMQWSVSERMLCWRMTQLKMHKITNQSIILEQLKILSRSHSFINRRINIRLVQKLLKRFLFLSITFWRLFGMTLNSSFVSLTSFWSKYFNSFSLISGIYPGTSSFLINISMFKSSKNGWSRIS